MVDSRWQKTENIFFAVLECPPNERTAFLEKVCYNDVELRKEVESLVAHAENSKELSLINSPICSFKDILVGPTELLIGKIIDKKYRIEERLSQGGMGTVYKATHLGIERSFAIKVIHSKYGFEDTKSNDRFKLEAKTLGSLKHPNIVAITDYGVANINDKYPLAYLVMEYLTGINLRDFLLEKAPLSLKETTNIIEQLCSGIDEAHRKGIIHFDLKPENIWLEPNNKGGYTVKILDFGLAKMFNIKHFDEQNFTVSLSCPGGTPLYMSPEQWQDINTDLRCDIYSTGIITYQMLTGKTPFIGNIEQLRDGHINQLPPSLDNKKRIPKPVAELIMTALAKDPTKRPATAKFYSDALRARAEGMFDILQKAIDLFFNYKMIFVVVSAITFIPNFGFKIIIDLLVPLIPSLIRFNIYEILLLIIFTLVQLITTALNIWLFLPIVLERLLTPDLQYSQSIKTIFSALKVYMSGLKVLMSRFSLFISACVY
jgi:serine/threonine protein kinase